MSKARKNGYLESIPTTAKGLINPSDAKFYYSRDEYGHPRITVCLGRDDRTGKVARGISICSKNDTVDKSKGRKLAYVRMNQAKASGTTTGLITCDDLSAVTTFQSENPDINFKSEAHAEVNAFEQDLLKTLD